MGETEMEVTTIDSTKKFKENMPRSWQKKIWLVQVENTMTTVSTTAQVDGKN